MEELWSHVLGHQKLGRGQGSLLGREGSGLMPLFQTSSLSARKQVCAILRHIVALKPWFDCLTATIQNKNTYLKVGLLNSLIFLPS
jgi:hypothetical protein